MIKNIYVDDYNEYMDGIFDFLLPAKDTNWLADSINKLIADQQARVGRFLTYKQKLLSLKARAENIQRYDPDAGSTLKTRAEQLIIQQNNYESGGMALISKIGELQKNPVVLAILRSPDFLKYASQETVEKKESIFATISSILTMSTALNNNLLKHESAVVRLEKDIVSVESRLTGKGIIPAITKITEAPLATIKWVGIGAVAVFALYVLSRTAGRAPRAPAKV